MKLSEFRKKYGEGTDFDLDYGTLLILGLCIYIAVQVSQESMMRKWIYDCWNHVMDAEVNPLKNIPDLIFFVLDLFW